MNLTYSRIWIIDLDTSGFPYSIFYFEKICMAMLLLKD